LNQKISQDPAWLLHAYCFTCPKGSTRNIVGGRKPVSMARSEKPKAAAGENGAAKWKA